MSGASNIAVGAVVFLIGLFVTIGTMSAAGSVGRYVVAYGAIAVGLVQMIRGFVLRHDEQAEARVTLGKESRHISGQFTEDDYPEEARLDGIEGRVKLSFFVDEAGAVQDVQAVASSGSDLLDDAAATVISRFRYEPALNLLNEPIAHYRELTVNWQLPSAEFDGLFDEPLDENAPAVSSSYINASMNGDVWSGHRLRELYEAGWFSPSARFYPVQSDYASTRDMAPQSGAFGYAARVDPPADDFRDKYDHQYDMEGPYPEPDLKLVKGNFRGWVTILHDARSLQELFPDTTLARAERARASHPENAVPRVLSTLSEGASCYLSGFTNPTKFSLPLEPAAPVPATTVLGPEIAELESQRLMSIWHSGTGSDFYFLCELTELGLQVRSRIVEPGDG